MTKHFQIAEPSMTEDSKQNLFIVNSRSSPITFWIDTNSWLVTFSVVMVGDLTICLWLLFSFIHDNFPLANTLSTKKSGCYGRINFKYLFLSVLWLHNAQILYIVFNFCTVLNWITKQFFYVFSVIFFVEKCEIPSFIYLYRF